MKLKFTRDIGDKVRPEFAQYHRNSAPRHRRRRHPLLHGSVSIEDLQPWWLSPCILMLSPNPVIQATPSNKETNKQNYIYHPSHLGTPYTPQRPHGHPTDTCL